MFAAVATFRFGEGPTLIIVMWFCIALGVDLLLTAGCRDRLSTHFRQMAAKRF